ncbi:MAG: sugar ABC transporter [Candidatus Aminicenantes bacterium RBG_19FT_COMBO_58_17]|nr:MAG: sugar ABC transporter [Candidatus Aminicenantes bacterium RBG_19FT_COMBO_58_17]
MDESQPPLLRMERISKNFGATRALDEVDFDLRPGEAHALLGENGAGKSTLIKILSGAVKPDGGTIWLEGCRFAPAGPLESRLAGISVIYQELNLAPHLTVEENIMLGREWHGFGFLRRRRMREKVREALGLVHHAEIPPDIPVRQLSVAARQVVEIARALVERARILVMDEPTSSLTGEDSQRLFGIIRRLKSQGVGIIYISHFLEEVQQVADRTTVLRDGRKAGSGRMEEVTLEHIIKMMVGGEVKELFPQVVHQAGEDIIESGELKGKRMAAAVTLALRRGEILGIAGLVGSGRTEFLRTLFGLDTVESGRVRVGRDEVLGGGPRQRIRKGIGLLSEDRQGEGLALSRSIADNLTLSFFAPYVRAGFLRNKQQRKAGWEWIAKMKIKATGPGQPVSSLSGGNQQKVALARLLHQNATVFLLDEPTRGIDIVSKSQIYEAMGDLASRGKSILFVSSYFPELLGVCDRIAVFYRGRLVELRPTAEWDEEALLAAATMGKPAAR